MGTQAGDQTENSGKKKQRKTSYQEQTQEHDD